MSLTDNLKEQLKNAADRIIIGKFANSEFDAIARNTADRAGLVASAQRTYNFQAALEGKKLDAGLQKSLLMLIGLYPVQIWNEAVAAATNTDVIPTPDNTAQRNILLDVISNALEICEWGVVHNLIKLFTYAHQEFYQDDLSETLQWVQDNLENARSEGHITIAERFHCVLRLFLATLEEQQYCSPSCKEAHKNGDSNPAGIEPGDTTLSPDATVPGQSQPVPATV